MRVIRVGCGMFSKRLLLVVGILGSLLCLSGDDFGFAQGLAPSTQFNNPLSLPRMGAGPFAPGGFHETDAVTLSGSMFPVLFNTLPHLRGGFVYNFGKDFRQGRGIVDYLVPLDITPATTIFGQFHGEFQDFWRSSSSRVLTAPAIGAAGLREIQIPSMQRYDISVGGGIRRTITWESILGFNAFYDTSNVHDQWYSSGGIGLEWFSRLPGNGLIDVEFNYYGKLFARDTFVNTFRHGPSNFDVEVGYSQPVLQQAIDLRAKVVGYQFDVGHKVWGWRVGAEATTRNGMFRLEYDYTHDNTTAAYHSVGGYVHLGFQLDNLLRGQSPISMPEPIFGSPRNVSRIFHEHVRRRWDQPVQVVKRRGISALPEIPFLIWLGVTQVPSQDFQIQNVDLAGGIFEVLEATSDNAEVFLNYQFRMSDGSIQPVIATVALVSNPGGGVAVNEWSPAGTTAVGPASMDSSASSSTLGTFGQQHHISTGGAGPQTAIIFITISVNGRPEIAPLVITCRVVQN
jgi:hypothetical protein